MPHRSKSKGRQCEGVEGTRTRCTLSRNGEGAPIFLNKACTRCGQWRCKSHCACGQAGELSGQKKGRPPIESHVAPKKVVVQSSLPVEAVQQTLGPLLPVGRPSPLSVEPFVADASWWERALEEAENASHILISSFLYDEPSLHELLKRRLQSTASCHVIVLVDEAEYAARRFRHQRPRLIELRNMGALVFLCKGGDDAARFGPRARPGNFHAKAIILDRRVMCSRGA